MTAGPPVGLNIFSADTALRTGTAVPVLPHPQLIYGTDLCVSGSANTWRALRINLTNPDNTAWQTGDWRRLPDILPGSPIQVLRAVLVLGIA